MSDEHQPIFDTRDVSPPMPSDSTQVGENEVDIEKVLEAYRYALFAHTAYGDDPRVRWTDEEQDAAERVALHDLREIIASLQKDRERIDAEARRYRFIRPQLDTDHSIHGVWLYIREDGIVLPNATPTQTVDEAIDSAMSQDSTVTDAQADYVMEKTADMEVPVDRLARIRERVFPSQDSTTEGK